MDLTPRIRQILLILLTQNDMLPTKILAQKINVSKRTVQRELEYIEYFLKKYDINLCSKTGTGIWLEGEESQKQLLLEQLEKQDSKDFADKSERRKGLMLELLRDQTPKKIYYFANLFSVSESTISKDIERIEPWFQQFDLSIIRKQGYGVLLHGSETNFRMAIREFIARYMDTPVLIDLYEENDISSLKSFEMKHIKSKYHLLDEDILRQVGICFSSIPDEKIRRLTQESYIGLILHVTIAIERVKRGEIIESNEELMKKLKHDEDYNLALLIVNSLEEEFGIEIPNIEIVFITLHIKASKLQRVNDDYEKDDFLPEYNNELKDLVEGMIISYDEQFACILGADEEFVTGLVAHLRPTLIRLRNHMPIENPHLEEMKETYPELFEKCLRVGKFLEAYIGCEIPETEIGYFAIHFGAALVRLENEKEKKRTVNIGLVCASGIGISRLMVSRLQKFLKTRAKLTTYGKSDINQFVIERNDFFVSSMELNDIDAKVLLVSPLLPEEDLYRIDQLVQQYALLSNKREYNADFMRQMEKINDLAGKIKEILRNFSCIVVNSDVNFQQLLEGATKSITPYEEKQMHIINDIKKREEIATQILPELGIALLHARTKGVLNIGFHICTPQNHKNFQDPYMQSIEAAVVMLIPEDDNKLENSQLLGYVSENIIDDESFLSDIKSGVENRIRDKLSLLLKQYFNKFLDVV